MKAKVKTWLRNVENGNIASFTEKVLNEIKCNTPLKDESWLDNFKQGISTYELRESLGMSHQTLTSRLSELHDEGLIKDVSQVEINNTFYSVYMFIKDLSYQEHTKQQREEEKFSKWIKKAKQYEHLLSVSMKLEINGFLYYRGEEMLFENVREINRKN